MVYAPEVTAARYPTLIDVAKRTEKDGSIAKIAELLNQTNAILDDAVFLEGNETTGHTTTVRSDLPTATWRKLNYGVKPTKSKTAQVTDTIGMLEDYAEVDKDLASLNGNTAEFRMSEDTPHIEGISQQMATALFYSDTAADPEKFLGLTPRYDILTDATHEATKPDAFTYGDHVVSHGGSNADTQTSIWLIVWGPNTVHMIFPKGSQGGLLHEDLGEQTLFDDDGGRFQGYRTHYQWKTGLCVRDWRYIVRICNFEMSTPATFNEDKFITAINTIPNIAMGRAAFYCNRQVKTQLDIRAQDKSNVYLTIEKVFGVPQTSFWGIPVRQCDAILNTEAVVS